jgi:hypothetical protein
MPPTYSNLTVSGLNYSPTNNELSINYSYSQSGSENLTGIVFSTYVSSYNPLTQTPSPISTQTWPVSTNSGSGVDVPNATVINLLKVVPATLLTTPYIYVTGFTYTNNSTPVTYVYTQGAEVFSFLLASSNYLNYVNETSVNFNFYSFNNNSAGTPWSLTLTDSNGDVGYNGSITNISATSVSQSILLTPGEFSKGFAYNGSLVHTEEGSSSSSTLTLSSQVLSTTPTPLPTWNTLQFTTSTDLSNITVIAPPILFDTTVNSFYNTPYLGYASDASLNYKVYYVDNTGTSKIYPSNSWAQFNIVSCGASFNIISQTINDISSVVLYSNSLGNILTGLNIANITSVKYYISNAESNDSTTAITVPITSPYTDQFTSNQITINYPLTSTLQYNNNITVDLSSSVILDASFSTAYVQLLNGAGTIINSQTFSYNNTDLSGSNLFNTVTLNNASVDSSWNLLIYPTDSLGNNGYNTVIPLTNYVANNVTTAITAVNCSYALDGSLNSLDLSFNVTNPRGSTSITIPENPNNYFDASLNYVDGSMNPLAVSSRSRSIGAALLQSNTTYFPAVVNNVTGKLTYPYASNADLEAIVNYIPLGASNTITYQNAYVFEASTGTITVGQSDPNYNTIPMNIVTPNVTTRMFNQPRLISFLGLDNNQILNNVSIMTFLTPQFNKTTYDNSYNTYQKNQFLNSYTMYDYVISAVESTQGTSSSGVISYTQFNGLTDASNGQPYTITYNGTVSGSVSTNQEIISIAVDGSNTTVSTPSTLTTNPWSVATNLSQIQGKEITSTIQVFNTAPTVANSMGFNTLEMMYDNLTTGYTVSGVTLILFRSGVYVGENLYQVGSQVGQLTPVPNTNKAYLLSLPNNITTVLQGNYTIMAVTNISSAYGYFNIFSTVNYTSYSQYPELNSVVTGTNNQLRLQISNSFSNPTTLSVDDVELVTVAAGAIPSRPVNIQLTNNGVSTKTLFATLTSGSNTNSYNISVAAPGTANVSVTQAQVTEYNPPLVLLPANGLGQNNN